MLKYSNMEEFLNDLSTAKTEKEARLNNVISNAFVGDSLYCSFVRVRLANEHNQKAGDLHKMANKYVNAVSQAYAYTTMKEQGLFTQVELDIANRARNAKLSHIAKHASIEEYKLATAFESLCGYLFFSGQKARLMEIMDKAMDIIRDLEKGK